MSYFSGLENPGTFGVPELILRDIGTELFGTHKTRTVPGKPGGMGSLIIYQIT
jgi:hypothetical protein